MKSANIVTEKPVLCQIGIEGRPIPGSGRVKKRLCLFDQIKVTSFKLYEPRT